MNNAKNIIIVFLSVCLTVCLALLVYTSKKYSTNETSLHTESDSLHTVISMQKNKYDSLKTTSDSLYVHETSRSDSLWQLLQTNQVTNKSKVTYIYKDSTIIKENENTEIQTVVETKYVDKIVEKEVIKVVHDTVYVSKLDTIYNEEKTEVKTETDETKKEVVVKDDIFNIYLDAGVSGNLDLDIIPEAQIGIIFKEKFYGELGVNYNGKVNPNLKVGLRLNVF